MNSRRNIQSIGGRLPQCSIMSAEWRSCPRWTSPWGLAKMNKKTNSRSHFLSLFFSRSLVLFIHAKYQSTRLKNNLTETPAIGSPHTALYCALHYICTPTNHVKQAYAILPAASLSHRPAPRSLHLPSREQKLWHRLPARN